MSEKECRTVIDVQGRQGGNRFNHHNVNSSDLAYIVRTDNTLNIYNYYYTTGICTDMTGPTGASGPMLLPPTETYAYGYFDESRNGGREISLTSEEFIVPWNYDYNNIRNILTITDYNGKVIGYEIVDGGTYEISYQINLKNAAKIGSRLFANGYFEPFHIEPANGDVEYAASMTIQLNSGDRIGLGLYSNTSQTITLKGGMGACLLIKQLRSF